MIEWSSDLDKDELKAVYNDAVSVPLRPLIITGGKIERNKKYRKGWLEYYNLNEFLKDIPRVEKIKMSKKKSTKKDADLESSDSDSD